VSEAQPPSFVSTVATALLRVKAWFHGLSRPARVMLVSTTAMGVLALAFVLFERANEPYVALFSQLDREDASSIVAKLKELKIPYRVGADGTTVEAPESRVRELRLELAGAGLPRGGGVGFESFDKMRLGATDFEQRVLYRRALEGELARTIGTIGAVESSRVHLVLPEKSVFISRNEPASASIVLRLRPARALGPSEVGGIVHLVASAVPGLEADRVTIVTTDGTMVHRPRKSGSPGESDGTGEDDDMRAAARSYESALEDRVKTLLEKVVGPGHADVRVTADVDPGRTERTEEHYDPSRWVLRSEEQMIERASGQLDDTVAGVPGAESNLPTGSAKGSTGSPAAPKPAASGSAAPASSGAPIALAAGSTRESHTRNYEIDRVTEKRFVAVGALRRLTVAVVLDGTKGDNAPSHSREDLDKLAALVKTAAGASDLRGDVVTVERMPFVAADSEASSGALPAPSRLEIARRWAPIALGAVGAIFVLALAGAALRRGGAYLPSLAAQIGGAVTPAPLATTLSPLLDSGDLRAKAHARAVSDPATAALVLRFWLGSSAGDARDTAKS
jgi:flagellar M-ring protein FliF